MRPKAEKGVDYTIEEKKNDAKDKISVEVIERAIQPPAFIKLEDVANDPKDKRVSKSEDWLHKKIMDLFLSVKPEWKLEEIEKKLDHPKAGI